MRLICSQFCILRFCIPRVSHNPPLSPVLPGIDGVTSRGFLAAPVASLLVLRRRHVCVQLACLIQTLGTFGLLGYHPTPPPCKPPACLTSTVNPQRHQLQREPCSSFTQACLCCNVCDIFVMINESCDLIYVMLLLYFRPVTEKKTPLLRNHSICSDPQRFTFVLNLF